jgi:hypothetical protein
MIVANKARPLDPQSPIAGRRLDHAKGWMPIDADDPFSLASFDQHVVADDGKEERQSPHPIDRHLQSVIVA